MADWADVSAHTIFRAESKGIIPRGQNIQKIAQALGVTESDLFADPNIKTESKPSSTDNRNQAIVELFAIVPTLNESQIRDILALANGLATIGTKSVDTKKLVR